MNTINLKTKMLAFIFAIASLSAAAQGGYGEIRGIIKDAYLQPIPFATVKILQGNLLIGGAQTDFEGRYHYKPLVPGTYDMIVIENGHQTQPVNKIAVVPNEASYVDVKMLPNTLGTVTVMAKAIDFTKSGADRSMYSMVSLDGVELGQNAGYTRGDIKGSLSIISSNAIESPDGEVHVRGTRGDATGYFIDGVRALTPNTIPGLAIENLTFFSGGVPAMYGDLQSGAVMITTKSYFSGIREKNIRNAEAREQREAQAAEEKAKKEEAARAKEIEEEKLKEKKN